MSTRHLVDPELSPLLDIYPTVTITAENLQDLRDSAVPQALADDCGVASEERTIQGFETPIVIRIYRPRCAAGAVGCILHIHGGGFVGGNIAEVEYIHRPLAAELNCVIVTVDYRLAPETRFPGNIEDCYAALAWTFANASELKIDRARIGLMGESAGGGLAAALALLARDRGEYAIAFQHLIYPMLDDRTCVADGNPFSGEFIWNRENNLFGWTSLLGQAPGGPGISGYAAPARATDLTGLPPTFMGTAALDLFVDENIEYAARLNRAGVPTELHVWPGAFHGFDLIPGTRVGDAATRASRDALRRALSTVQS